MVVGIVILQISPQRTRGSDQTFNTRSSFLPLARVFNAFTSLVASILDTASHALQTITGLLRASRVVDCIA